VSSEQRGRQPDRRVIVLGASNVTRGLRVFCQTAARFWGHPLDVMAAIGHGRSFGLPSRVLGRTLPSISHCELWEDWRARPPIPTAAIITDVGNDLLYGAAPRQIADWVRDCSERLAERCERVVISGLPIETVRNLAPAQFKIMRSILFPNSRITLREAIESSRELDERLAELAKAMNLGRTQPDSSWYGYDPIHIRRRFWPSAWEQLLDPWISAEERSPQNHRMDVGWRLMRLRPKHRWMFGIEQHHAQPVWIGADGSRLSLY
jgi:hypothetical protein